MVVQHVDILRVKARKGHVGLRVEERSVLEPAVVDVVAGVGGCHCVGGPGRRGEGLSDVDAVR